MSDFTQGLSRDGLTEHDFTQQECSLFFTPPTMLQPQLHSFPLHLCPIPTLLHQQLHQMFIVCFLDQRSPLFSAFPPKMVITKRYNSVERFTSMQLSDDGGGGEESMASQQQQRQQPSQMLAIPTWIDKQRPSEQQQPTPTGQQHISLMRRSSQEQLLQKPPVPSSPSSASHSLTLVPQQQPPSVAYGPSSSFQYQPQRQHQHPMMAHPLQPQQQLFARQYVQPTAAGQQHPPSHSIMRPASGGTNYAGPYAPVPTPAQSRQSFAPPANYYRPATQQPAESRSFLARKVPAPIWLSLSALQIVVGIVSVFIGALNASAYNCIIEPNIPIYLIISGVLLIVNGSVRSFFWLAGPSSSPSPQRQVDQQAKDGGGIPNKHMAEYALEGIVLFGMAILIILGCIWVYGASRYMQSQRYMFEWHYCNPTVYWTAWWSVTLHLGFFALLILGAIFLLLFGALGT